MVLHDGHKLLVDISEYISSKTPTFAAIRGCTITERSDLKDRGVPSGFEKLCVSMDIPKSKG
jgi:hypothetical protein